MQTGCTMRSLRLVGIALFVCCVASAVGLEDERRLRWELFVNRSYDPEIRPVINKSTPIVVQSYFSLQYVHTLDEIKQSFDTSGWLSLFFWNKKQQENHPGVRTNFALSSSGASFFANDTNTLTIMPRQLWQLPKTYSRFNTYFGENMARSRSGTIFWTDQHMIWNPIDYGGINQLLIAPSKIWKPDITLDNGVNGYNTVGDDNHLLRVTGETGEVFWSPGDIYMTGCSVDVTFYPFDIQTCPITFGSWIHDASLLELRVNKEHVYIDSLAENGQWTVLKTGSRNFTRPVDDITLTYIEFTIVMARRPLFHILNTIMPVFFLSMMSLLVFLVPPEAGEKMTLSVTVLLSLAVFLTLIGQTMPKTSTSVSLLAVYLVLVLFLDAMSVTLSAIVLHFYHRREDNSNDLKEKDAGARQCVKNTVRAIFMIGKVGHGENGQVGQSEDIALPNSESNQHKHGNTLGSNGLIIARKIDRISFVVLGSCSVLLLLVMSCVIFLHQADI